MASAILSAVVNDGLATKPCRGRHCERSRTAFCLCERHGKAHLRAVADRLERIETHRRNKRLREARELIAQAIRSASGGSGWRRSASGALLELDAAIAATGGAS